MTTARPAITTEVQAAASRALAAASLCIGIGVIAGGAYFMHRLHLDEFVLHPTPVAGIVLRNVELSGRKATYAAVVAFTDAAGRPVTFQDHMAFGRASFREGQPVSVFHDPQRPEAAMVDRGVANWVVPGICLAFAGFCFLGAWQRRAATQARRG